MKRYYSLLVVLTMFTAIQSLQSAMLTICNFSKSVLMVTPIWNKSSTIARIEPGKKKIFKSGSHKIKGIRWLEDITNNPNFIVFSETYQVTTEDKKEPHNALFLSNLNYRAVFSIKSNGYFFYCFGSDGSGSGRARFIDS